VAVEKTLGEVVVRTVLSLGGQHARGEKRMGRSRRGNRADKNRKGLEKKNVRRGTAAEEGEGKFWRPQIIGAGRGWEKTTGGVKRRFAGAASEDA